MYLSDQLSTSLIIPSELLSRPWTPLWKWCQIRLTPLAPTVLAASSGDTSWTYEKMYGFLLWNLSWVEARDSELLPRPWTPVPPVLNPPNTLQNLRIAVKLRHEVKPGANRTSSIIWKHLVELQKDVWLPSMKFIINGCAAWAWAVTPTEMSKLWCF